MNWLDKLIPPKVKNTRDKKGIPQGIWVKCTHCEETLYRPELERNMFVCTKCNNHMRISAQKRLESFFDDGKYKTIGENVTAVDALKFRDTKRYKDRLADALRKSEGTESLLVASGNLMSRPIVVAAFDFSFMGGSMASVAGERFLQGVKKAIELKAPFVCYSASGGARMQEALLSLMQMAKTSAALVELEKNKLPFISILTDPTMGGVSASLAMLGDVIIAEPNALIGFAGPRVIEQTVREKLPEGFQRAEFLLEHGAIDLIVTRHNMRQSVANIVSMLMKAEPASETSLDEKAAVFNPESDIKSDAKAKNQTSTKK